MVAHACNPSNWMVEAGWWLAFQASRGYLSSGPTYSPSWETASNNLNKPTKQEKTKQKKENNMILKLNICSLLKRFSFFCFNVSDRWFIRSRCWSAAHLGKVGTTFFVEMFVQSHASFLWASLLFWKINISEPQFMRSLANLPFSLTEAELRFCSFKHSSRLCCFLIYFQ